MEIENTWISDTEEKHLEIGYLIGFFNSDGYFSINSKGDFQIAFVQRDKDALVKIQDVLSDIDIESNLRSRKSRKNGWKLSIAYGSALDFVKLVEGRIHGQKSKELPIVKELLQLRYFHDGEYWKADNKSEVSSIVESWKSLRKKYEDEGTSIENRLNNRE